MILSKNRNIPKNDKCSICKNYITISDIQNNNFELSITKEKQKYMYIKLVLKGVVTMELKIEDKLQEIYKNLIIEVNFKDFRLYEIIIKLEYQGVQYESKIEYKYDANLTIDANLSRIVHIIDTQIIVPFYKKG